MRAKIGKQYNFSAGHWLPNVPDDHPCKRQHGHNYVVEVSASGLVDEVLGWVIDFGAIDSYMDVWLEKVDHRNLNDIIDNPTAEKIAIDALAFLEQSALAARLNFSVKVWETPKCWALVEGASA